MLFRSRSSVNEERIERLEDVVVRTQYRIRYDQKDIDCLARNIYYEAGVEPDVGKYAVGTITVNRVRTGHWGDTVCKVVYAPAQFSWTLSKRLAKPDPDIYAHCERIARTVLQGYGVAGLEHGLFYHADYIKQPRWADVSNRLHQIGHHIFYTRGMGSSIEI